MKNIFLRPFVHFTTFLTLSSGDFSTSFYSKLYMTWENYCHRIYPFLSSKWVKIIVFLCDLRILIWDMGCDPYRVVIAWLGMWIPDIVLIAAELKYFPGFSCLKKKKNNLDTPYFGASKVFLLSFEFRKTHIA